MDMDLSGGLGGGLLGEYAQPAAMSRPQSTVGLFRLCRESAGAYVPLGGADAAEMEHTFFDSVMSEGAPGGERGPEAQQVKAEVLNVCLSAYATQQLAARPTAQQARSRTPAARRARALPAVWLATNTPWTPARSGGRRRARARA